MILIILIIHVLIALALVIMVLLQRSEGGALGMGGGGGGATGGLMTGRAAGNLLTRSTGILGAAFMITSIGLAILAGANSSNRSLFENPPPADASAPVQQEQPAAPQPTVPLSR
jgi:preprotein translocase subunit SecG